MNKSMLKEKNYILPAYLFSIIKKYNLGINDLLLLVYFVNNNLVFDVSLIKENLKINEQEVLLAFNNLISKNIISLETKKDSNGKREEVVNLDYLYNEIIANYNEEEKENLESDIYSVFEAEFGRSISSMEYEIIRAWIEKGFVEELILGALKEAVYNGVNNLRYIDKILHEWQRKGYKTMKDVNNHSGANSNKNEVFELFDYNWLDDDNE